MFNDDVFLEIILDLLESQEYRLLSWGVTNSSFLELEVLSLIEQQLEELDPDCNKLSFSSSESVLEKLCNKNLIFKLPDLNKPKYRTRMAESVRLYKELRQMFPKNIEGNNWSSAPTLVSDLRFLRKKRSYPLRDHSAEVVLEKLTSHMEFSDIERSIFSELLSYSNGLYSLSAFQLRSCINILSESKKSKPSTATIVCAGTGSGKTLAFYLPVLTSLAQNICNNHTGFVQTVAIYPRNELLKDQFIETWTQARKIDGFLKQKGKRKILIGAFFGSTPHDHQESTLIRNKSWKKRGNGFICSYIRCPVSHNHVNCKGNMVWSDKDRLENIEKLTCDFCSQSIEHDEVILTRKRMLKEKPDILFSTTEMLNMNMGTTEIGKLFGIGSYQKTPQFFLLDEVHTYNGISGAHVALLIRRWRYLSGAKCHFVGLSATLKQPAKFMASLTGVEEFKVQEIAPFENEMEEDSAEYMLALRGDPASQTSLLSTTIQTAMLTKRILDNSASPKSEGIYGTKSFVFTDDVDVLQRLYYQLLDAEGRYSNGNFNPKKEPLASIRYPSSSLQRFTGGQSWDMPLKIGHSLDSNDRSDIKRTAAMDSGVDQSADIIVATASLEVGYNDPTVGAVVQHKAPRDNAQFLQRKGRAGRSRKMRPWTIVVLSDYGRDRMAFQSYETLFLPEIKVRTLPLTNGYVQKIQAAFSTMDWLSQQSDILKASTPKWSKKSLWEDLSGPDGLKGECLSKRQISLLSKVESVLSSSYETKKLKDHLKSSFMISEDEATSLLWDSPRAIMTTFLPTVKRRLKSLWSKGGEIKMDNIKKYHPMPDFVPSALFNDLSLPELEVCLPEEHFDNKMMPILQGMRDFAPGRISKRFASESIKQRHWVVPSSFTSEGGCFKFPIIEYCEESKLEFLSTCKVCKHDGVIQEIPCYRPHSILATTPPEEWNISETSNAFLNWTTNLIAPDKGDVVNIYQHKPWSSIFDNTRPIEFFTHQNHCPVQIIRFSTGSRGELKYSSSKESTKVEFDFEFEGKEVAIGFSLWVDGVSFRFNKPSLNIEFDNENLELLAGLRTSRFIDEVKNDNELIENPFLAGWVAESFIACVICEAILSKCSIEEATLAVSKKDTQVSLIEVPHLIFQTLNVDESESNDQDLQLKLKELLSNDHVLSRLLEWAKILWDKPDNEWSKWLNKTYSTTLGAALQQTIYQICPEAGEDSLIVDLDVGPSQQDKVPEDTLEIWISETDIGGGGILEKFQRAYSENPRRFYELLESNLRPGDYELMDLNLSSLLSNINEDFPLANALKSVRNAESHEQHLISYQGLIDQCNLKGFMTNHSFLSAINTRVLKPGSDHNSDELLNCLISEWKQQEIILGVELPQRVFTFIKSLNNDLDKFISVSMDNQRSEQQWRFNLFNGLMWPRGFEVRDRSLTFYNPFSYAKTTEKLLLKTLLKAGAVRVSHDSTLWFEEVHEALRIDGRCDLVIDKGLEMKAAISKLIAEPIDTQGLHFYPRIKGVIKEQNQLIIMLEIAEAIQ
jgi:ATP-dependent Lhr-like helicase